MLSQNKSNIERGQELRTCFKSIALLEKENKERSLDVALLSEMKDDLDFFYVVTEIGNKDLIN